MLRGGAGDKNIAGEHRKRLDQLDSTGSSAGGSLQEKRQRGPQGAMVGCGKEDAADEATKAHELKRKMDSSKLGKLLQRAAAYSAFLRERLQKSRASLNATAGIANPGSGTATVGEDGNGTQPEVDPRQPKLVSGAVLRDYQVSVGVSGVFLCSSWLLSPRSRGLASPCTRPPLQ